jgi:flagellar motor switch protein FliG
MSKRLGDTIREEAEGMQVKTKDLEEAASDIVARIRQMEAEGTIFLTAEDEEE